MRKRTPEQQAADTARKRAARWRNKEVFGVCDPRRMPGAKPLPRCIPDPEDYGHPESDVRMGA